MHNNRGGGSHRKVDVKPPSVFSRDFTLTDTSPSLTSLDDIVRRAISVK